MADEQEETPKTSAPTVSADILVQKIRTAPSAAVVELLTSADVSGISSVGDSPLVTAASTGRADLVGRLLQAGAPADHQTSTGLTALAAAATDGHISCVNKLLAGASGRSGATVDLPVGRERSTALILAARNGHRAVCERLLEAGADVALTDAYGETAEAAAHNFETEGRLYSADLGFWEQEVLKRGAAIDAEPTPPPPLFPLDPMADLTRWYRSTDPTKMLWRSGAWVHMKRPAAGPVIVQERPRAFDATGYGVEAPRIPPEHSVYPAEKYGYAGTVSELQGSTADALTTTSRIARERTEKNPQMFMDDVQPTATATRAAVTDAAHAFQAIAAQESKLQTAFPDLPLRIGNAPTYSSGLQRSAMPTPTAAATLHPMLEPPSPLALSALLHVQSVKEAPPPAEPEPESPTKAAGKKK